MKKISSNKVESTVKALPTYFVSSTKTAKLIDMLKLTEEEQKQVAGGLRAAQCCKPDGGSCCPNKS